MSPWSPWRGRPEQPRQEPILERTTPLSDAQTAPLPAADPLILRLSDMVSDASAPAAPVSATGPSPVPDRAFRLRLMGLGAQIQIGLVNKGFLVEQAAKDVGMQISDIKSILAGELPDVSIRALMQIAAYVGGDFQWMLMLPRPPAPQSDPNTSQ